MSEIHASFSAGPAFGNGLADAVQFEKTTNQFSIESYLNVIDHAPDHATSEARTIRVIARSASFGAPGSIWRQLKTIRERHVRVLAVFTDFRAAHRDNELRRYAEVFGFDRAKENIRIARFRNAHNIIEQIQLGVREVWVEGGRFDAPASLVPEAGCNQADANDLAAARVSFEMIWAISNEIARKDFGS